MIRRRGFLVNIGAGAPPKVSWQRNWYWVVVDDEWRGVRKSVADDLLGRFPPFGFVHDSCTRVPDRMFGAIWWPACSIHDWEYSPEGPNVPRIISDFRLGYNIYQLCRMADWGRWESLMLAKTYFFGVRRLGLLFYKRGERDDG